MEYKDMIRDAKANGVASDKAMWQSVDTLSDMLCILRDEHPDEYWRFMRKQHSILYGNHYDRNFAEMDVEGIRYTGPSGEKRTGAHWTADQIEEAARGMSFPSGTTKWDKYVAFNSFYADMCMVCDDAQILKGAHRFYFADEDAPQGKIWVYMAAMYDARKQVYGILNVKKRSHYEFSYCNILQYENKRLSLRHQNNNRTGGNG